MEKRLKQLDEQILNQEILSLYRESYLRLKRLLAREYVASLDRKFFSPLQGATRKPEVVRADLKKLETAYQQIKVGE